MSEPEELEVKGPGGMSFRARGTDLIATLIIIALVINGAVQYMHMEDAKQAAGTVASTNKEVAAALRESNAGFTTALQEVVRSQRLSTCILATDQGQREKEYMKADSFCNRVSQ